jgi:hypothetical protein
MTMRAFFKILESYVMTALISLACAASMFALASAIHKISGSTGLSGTGLKIFSAIVAMLVIIVALVIVMEFLSGETLISYLGPSARPIIEYNRKSRDKKRKRLKRFKKPRDAPYGSVEFLASIELWILKISLGILLFISIGVFAFVFLIRLIFSNFVMTVIQEHRKDEY